MLNPLLTLASTLMIAATGTHSGHQAASGRQLLPERFQLSTSPDRPLERDMPTSPELALAVHAPRSTSPHLAIHGLQPGTAVLLMGAPPSEPGSPDLGPEALATAVADGQGQVRWNTTLAAAGWTYQALAPHQPGLPGPTLGPPLTPQPLGPVGVHSPQTGEVIVTEFMKDPVAATDAAGEYIELWNTTSAPLDIEGWVLSDMGADSTVLDNAGFGLVLPPRGHLVLVREPSPVFNGGLVGGFEYQGVTLSNGGDEIVLSYPDGTVVDEVVYLNGPAWPESPGKALELRQNRLGKRWNDLVENWCLADQSFGVGDFGSPGAFNGPCP